MAALVAELKALAMPPPSTSAQFQATMLRPLPTELPLPDNCTAVPGTGAAGLTSMRATGPETAATAAPASSMPAPQ